MHNEGTVLQICDPKWMIIVSFKYLKHSSSFCVCCPRCRIGDEGLISLAQALQNNRAIDTLFLLRNTFGAAGARALANVLLVNPTIQVRIISAGEF
jgi:hypothetical protein